MMNSRNWAPSTHFSIFLSKTILRDFQSAPHLSSRISSFKMTHTRTSDLQTKDYFEDFFKLHKKYCVKCLKWNSPASMHILHSTDFWKNTGWAHSTQKSPRISTLERLK